MPPSQCTPTRVSHRRDAGAEADAAPTASEIRHARRRVQNRLNQRAHRSRARDRRIDSSTQPYRVHRWRIDDGRDDMPHIVKPTRSNTRSNNPDYSSVPGVHMKETKSAHSRQPVASIHSEQQQEPNREAHQHYAPLSSASVSVPDRAAASSPWLSLSYCLLSDHLLHLIHFNVLRGLSYNKKFIKPDALLECSRGSASAQLNRVLPHLPATSASLSPLCLPESLAPTRLQLSCPHSNWIDVFPFPRMRDNLIRREGCFSHAEFLTDLLGNLISCMTAPPPRTGRSSRLLRPRVRVAAGQRDEEGEDCADGEKEYMDNDDLGDDAPADRRGLILWGEPFHKDSWEVTPGFLRKWSWAVEGCGELIESSNRWRTARGEMPLRMMLS
ncbi:hypothetical protein V8C44DRAFT_345944 [Trichoderma aethiopicum]